MKPLRRWIPAARPSRSPEHDILSEGRKLDSCRHFSCVPVRPIARTARGAPAAAASSAASSPDGAPRSLRTSSGEKPLKVRDLARRNFARRDGESRGIN